MNILKLKRNDTDGAFSAYVEQYEAGTLDPDWVSILLQLQDDPQPLLARLNAFREERERALTRLR